MRVLIVDIETSPHVVYRFDKLSRPSVAGIENLIHPSRILCVAWKWLGEEKDFVACEWDRGGQRAMMERVHAILDEADVVVHYNGKAFDVPHLNRAFIDVGLRPPSPFREVDLYHAIRAKFALPSNRLKYVAQWLGVDPKGEPGGIGLWRRVLEGTGKEQEAAQREMRNYCARDVHVTEGVYNEILALIPNLPNAGLYADDGEGQPLCPTCGSSDLEKKGFAYTGAGKFQRWVCRGCGRHSRGTHRVATTELRPL